MFGESSDLLEKKLGLWVFRLMTDVESFREILSQYFETPFATTNFNITNDIYEDYERKEIIISESLSQLNKILRQWKLQMSPQMYQTFFIP